MKRTITLSVFTALLLSVNSVQAQDLPTTALSLTIGTTAEEFPLILSNVNATNSEDTDTTITFPFCASYGGGDSWCIVEVPENGAIQLLTIDIGGGVEDTGMAVYEGVPGDLVEIDCNDDYLADLNSYLLITNRTPGEVLYVRTFAYSNFDIGEYSLSAFSINTDTPVNDNVSGAIELILGSTFDDFAVVGTNENATNSEDIDPTIPDPSCSFYNGGDVWYFIDITTQESIIIETGMILNGLSDTGMAIYQENSGSLSQIDCNDDGGDGAHSKISLSGLTGGERLYIRVFDYGNGDFGLFEISAYENIVIPLINDDPDGATELMVGESYDDFSLIGTNVGATNSGFVDGTIQDPSCILFFEGGDVWFTAEVPSSGELTIETKGLLNSFFGDSSMSVYEGSIGALTEIACVDDTDESLFAKIELTDRTPGEIVFIRVFEFGNNSFGEFEISAYDQEMVSVEDQDFIETLSISPNPVQDILSLKSISPIGNVKVYSLLGEKVSEINTQNSEYQLDVSNMINGTYLIQFRKGEKIATYKFVKI